MRFGSVCSGIEAASVAWHPLGWKAAWLSEIEPFPSAVLAHHYPDVPNLGDMTKLPERISSGEVPAPDVFCGGTPCQAFSVAGLRKSLDDARGNLSLIFCEIANAIDTVRAGRGDPPAIIFWENVPGVLSTKDNAFGCFLAALAGEDDALEPPGGGWSNAGYVSGPQRTIAWRTLDAQYFGLAQRRRRVFVVASARDDFDPAAVLFEWGGLRRDTAPSRQAREVAPTIPARSLGGGGLGTDFDCDGGVIASDVCPTLRAGGNRTGGDRPPGTDVDTADSLLAYAIQAGALRANPDSGPDGAGIQADHAYTLEARAEVQCVAQPIAFAQNQRDEVRVMQVAGALAAEPGAKQQTYLAQPYTLAIRGRGDCHNLEYRQDGTANALLTPNGGRGGIGVGAVAQPIGLDEEQNAMIDAFGTLKARTAGGGFEGTVMQTNMAVRRLTPVECERLQGFPDGYTNIPWRKKDESPDGPRYKALGNSWAVPNVRWIGKRIQEQINAA
jgi:DNA (cytosine-5)-methyltransferase 1